MPGEAVLTYTLPESAAAARNLIHGLRDKLQSVDGKLYVDTGSDGVVPVVVTRASAEAIERARAKRERKRAPR